MAASNYAGKVGIALIVSNDYCDTSNRKNLPGTMEDALRMNQAFTFLGYKVIVKQNVSREDLISECVKLRSYDYSPANGCKRIAVVYSGHGQDGELIMQDNSVMKVEELVNAFKPHFNQTLVNTVRMFFIDACRGVESDPGVALVSRSPKGGSFIERLSTEAGIVIAYSTTRHHKAYENASGGLWMRLLAHEMCTSDVGLLSILLSTNKKLNEFCSCQPKDSPIQTAESTNSLIEDVFFLKERPTSVLQDHCSIPQHPVLAMQFPNLPFVHHIDSAATSDQLPLNQSTDVNPSFMQDAPLPNPIQMATTNQPTVQPQQLAGDDAVQSATSTVYNDQPMDTSCSAGSQSHLREVLTAQGITCQYQITETPSGMDGRPWYSCELSCSSKGMSYKFRSGQYRDRDEAKQDVNKQALAEPDIGNCEIFSRSVVESYQEKLLSYCSKKKYRPPSYSTQHRSNGYVSSVLVPRNGRFEGEVATDLEKAKESAAKQALRDLGEIHFSNEVI